MSDPVVSPPVTPSPTPPRDEEREAEAITALRNAIEWAHDNGETASAMVRHWMLTTVDLRYLLTALDALRAERAGATAPEDVERDLTLICREALNGATQQQHAARIAEAATRVREAFISLTAALTEARKDSARLNFLDTCTLDALTSIFGMVGDGNDVRGQIDRERAVAATAKAPT